MGSPIRPARINTRGLIERQVRRWDRVAAALKRKPAEATLAELTHRPALTVTGPVGSGSGYLAAELCRELDYELFGRELMDEVAADLGCQRLLLDRLDEKVQSSLETMFASFLRGREIDHREYLAALFRVMNLLANQGGAVILGRGGAFILGNKTALRVRTQAPAGERIERVSRDREVDTAEAKRIVEEKDRQQREFCRHFFRRDIDDPRAYDLIINTERLDPGACARLVLAALAERGVTIERSAV